LEHNTHEFGVFTREDDDTGRGKASKLVEVSESFENEDGGVGPDGRDFFLGPGTDDVRGCDDQNACGLCEIGGRERDACLADSLFSIIIPTEGS
jgi:hypothetical protein